MSPRDRFEGWVSSHAIRFIVYVLGVGIAWGVLTAEVKTKADKGEVDSIRADMAAVKRMVCRMAGNAKDSACP